MIRQRGRVDALPRHTLVWPVASAHARLAAQFDDDEAHAALDAWFGRGFPLVIRRADAGTRSGVAVGLPLPPDRGKRRLAMTLTRGDVACFSAPPTLAHIAIGLAETWRWPLAALDRDARSIGVTLRGFGSAAWQALTGLAYLHDDSDIDLLLAPASAAQLDATLALFERWERNARRRIDAEIVFDGDRAVAWREWVRAADGSVVLAKAREGAALVPRASLVGRLPAGIP
jgi:phosphoribosyl-dephospho-CoA transferase